MKRLTTEEKLEMDAFPENQRFISCELDLVQRMTILHSLKDKGLLRFKGTQGSLQFFERVT